MTARVVLPGGTCSVKDCGNLAAFRLNAKLPSSDPKHKPLDVHTGLVVCEHHKEHPVQTAAAFFETPQRQFIDEACRSEQVPTPNYAAAVWDFPPLLKPATEAAH